MATWTSQQNGNWSRASNNTDSPWYDGPGGTQTLRASVPADGDTVTLGDSDVVTFDVDQSAFTTGITFGTAGTNSKLTWITDGTVTHLKVANAASLGFNSGAGWEIGSVATPIPAPAGSTPEVATITFLNSATYVNSNNAIFTIVGEQRTCWTHLTNAALSTDTQITIDDNMGLRAGDVIAIARSTSVAGSSVGSICTVQSRSGNVVTLTAQIGTADRAAGTAVGLLSHNILIQKGGTAGGVFWSAVASIYIRSAQFLNFSSVASSFLKTGIIEYCSFRGSVSSWYIINGCYSPVLLHSFVYGMNTVGPISGCQGGLVEDCCFVAGGGPCGFAWANMACRFIDIEQWNCNAASSSNQTCFFKNVNFKYNVLATAWAYYARYVDIENTYVDCSTDSTDTGSADMNGIRNHRFYNCLLGASVGELAFYNIANIAPSDHTESFDHDQVANAYRSWTKGGICTKQATTYPTGKSYSYQVDLNQADYYGFHQQRVWLAPGQTLKLTAHLRKTASMTYLPRVITFLEKNDQLEDPTASVIETWTMTNSTDTWESHTFSDYTNSSDVPVQVIIRAQGQNASGSMFTLFEVSGAGTGSGGISRGRLVNA